MPNRLSVEISPYLLQHAENPVDWYPWGHDALEKARQEQKPIFLSIGYAACHWCHVMSHESFEDPRIAGFLNDHFINVKVDREERPDLDAIYMNAVVSLTGQGGWPLSVFLTPEGEPFFGGTYFPPQRRFNMPSFEEVISTISRLWRDDRERLLKSGKEISDHLRKEYNRELRQNLNLNPETIEKAAMRLAQAYDWSYGGWGTAPKFPQPMALEFLLRTACGGDRLSLDVARHALDAMGRGGLFDLLGGGFARYSTDNEWRVPHFEKMLYDNALLARDYLYAYLLTKDPLYERVCRETLAFLADEMLSSEGGFFSSLDADSEGMEGKFYLWSYHEVTELLREAQSYQSEPEQVDWAVVFCEAFGITQAGQLDGLNVLQRTATNEELIERFSVSSHQLLKIISQGIHNLKQRRSLRTRPAEDDKILVSWNSLALWAFAEAARYLNEPKYLQIAQQNASFLLDNLFIDGKLMRVWRSGKAQQPAFLDDHAGLALALIALYQTDHDARWYQAARKLASRIDEAFSDTAGGYFDSQADEDMRLRPKELQDNAVPSGNSLASRLFAQLGAYSGNNDWKIKAESLAANLQQAAVRYPTAFGSWLCAAHFSLGPVAEIALLSDAACEEDLAPFLEIIWEKFQPKLVLAAAVYPPQSNAPELLSNRPLVKQRATAYLCENFTCQQPVNTPAEFATLLAEISERNQYS